MFRVVFGAVLLGLACSTPPPLDSGDGSAPPSGKPAWFADSQRVEVACNGSGSDPVSFRSERGRLTGEQLSLLSSLQVAPQTRPPNKGQLRCALSVTDGEGLKTFYVVDEHAQGSCTGCVLDPNSITFSSFLPFAQTIPCHLERASATAQLNRDPMAPDDERCGH